MSNFSDIYNLHNLVAKNTRFELFKCTNKTGEEFLYQTPTEIGDEHVDKNVFFLDKLNIFSNEVQASCETVLNYNLGFPSVVDRFDDNGQSSYVLKFNGVDCISDVIPIIKLCKEGFCVDLRTSAWIMGKLLKTISFAHANGIEICDISANNVLMYPNMHYVVIFDWSKAELTKITSVIAKREIKKAANVIIKAVGGDLASSRLCDADDLYINYIEKLAENGETTAVKAHTNFYNIVDELCSIPGSVWKSGFHEFKAHKIGV